MLAGLLVGLLVVVSFVMTFLKLPRPIRRWAGRHPLISDFLAGVAIWGIVAMVSKTIVGLITAVVAEISWAIFLHIYKEHPEAIDRFASKYL